MEVEPPPVFDTSLRPRLHPQLRLPSPSPVLKPTDLAEADAAFLAKKYDVAGPSLHGARSPAPLPAQRRHHWAYCRWVDLVRRINAKPTTAEEWASSTPRSRASGS